MNSSSKRKRLLLSVVIVNYKATDLLLGCLGSFLGSLANLSCEIFVVDNNSGEDAGRRIQTSFPQVTLIANKDNKGFAAGCNQALKRARGAYALLLNPDTFLKEGDIKGPLEFLEGHPDVGIVGCKILNRDGDLQRSAFPTPSVLGDVLSGLRLDRLHSSRNIQNSYLRRIEEESEPFQVGWVSGACLIVRKETLQDIGFLDENFFLFAEDTDLCLRARKRGWNVMYHPGLTLVHLGGESTRRNLGLKINFYYRKRLYFATKHFGLAASLLLRGVSLAELLAKTIIVTLSRKIDPVERKERLEGYKSSLKLILRRF
jgi:GT2 family glycosyltransferase